MTINLPWKSWLILGAAVALAVFLWNREGNRRRDAERQKEAAELALKQQIVETEQTRRQLQGSVDQMLAENAQLRDAYEAAVVAAPDAKPASASQLDTGPLTVHARKPPVAPASPMEPAQAPVPPPPASGPSSPPIPQCALRDIDRMSIEVEQVELQTGAGNTIVVGTAAAYVLDPVKALLAEGRFKSYISAAGKLEVRSEPRWGVRASVAWTPQGRVQGGGLLFPPIHLLGVRLEPSAAVLGGATFVGQFDLGVRF